jgi:hypothetical protein
MALVAVVRADVLWRDFGIPFVPFAKGGLGAGAWRAWNSGGTARSPNGTEGRGMSWGTFVAVGASFPLDALDPGTARMADLALGINVSHVFIEYGWLALEGLFQRHALYVGTSTWTAGLAFEL